MDVKNFSPTATITYNLDLGGGREEPLTLEVAFLALDEVGDHIPEPKFDKEGRMVPGKRPKFSALAREMLIGAVQSWDLTESGFAIECNEQMKRKYLPVILGLRIKGVESVNPMDSVLGRALLFFAINSENYLKN